VLEALDFMQNFWWLSYIISSNNLKIDNIENVWIDILTNLGLSSVHRHPNLNFNAFQMSVLKLVATLIMQIISFCGDFHINLLKYFNEKVLLIV